MPTYLYRVAELGDAADIYRLFERIADEIPLLLDTLSREEAFYAAIRNCVRGGESWVAVDAADGVVGALLAELNQARRHYAEHEVLDLRYAGVAESHRNYGIFAALLARLIERMVPVTATVNEANRSDIARQLEKAGFAKMASPGGVQHFRREPGMPACPGRSDAQL